MRGTILTASHFYLTGAIWFAVYVGATTGYVRFIDLALGALGVDALLQSVVLMAMGVTTASAAAWLAWTTRSSRLPRAGQHASVCPRPRPGLSFLAVDRLALRGDPGFHPLPNCAIADVPFR